VSDDRSEANRIEIKEDRFALSEPAPAQVLAPEKLAPGEFFARLGLGNPYEARQRASCKRKPWTRRFWYWL